MHSPNKVRASQCEFNLPKASRLLLSIEDASEGVEVFLNGESCGIQIAPPMVYELSGREGRNQLVKPIGGFDLPITSFVQIEEDNLIFPHTAFPQFVCDHLH